MMKNASTVASALALGLSFLPACGGGGTSSEGGSGAMDVAFVTNGFGDVLPYRIRRVDPTTGEAAVPEERLQITSKQILFDNATPLNKVLPPAQFPDSAVLPSNLPGNHFFAVTFTKAIDIDSVMDRSPGAQANYALSQTITLVEYDPATGSSAPIPVRVFIDGQTYAGSPEIDPVTGSSAIPLQTWVTLTNGKPTANPAIDNNTDGIPDGVGFPGTQDDFNGMAGLISPRTMVFVVDRDRVLATHEAFPAAGSSLRLRISSSVRSVDGEPIARSAAAVTTVGLDQGTPEVATTPPPTQLPFISPGQGLTGVDPMTDITVEFTEAVQPLSVGSFPDGSSPILSAAIGVTFGSSPSVTVPFTAEPVSALDLTTFVLSPTFNFPGDGPADVSCSAGLNLVRVIVNANQVEDLQGTMNVQPIETTFQTGEGPGVVNVPVTPDTIYVGRGGAVPGLSVIDLNGFGGGTGNNTFDPQNPIIQGNSNYPNNPNVALNGPGLIPLLPSQGICTLDGGSAGVYTLAKDSQLNDRVARAPLLTSVGDMMLGRSLDGTFNNGPFPFGCQSLGGNSCAFDGIKALATQVNVNSEFPTPTNNIVNSLIAGENLSSWAPHPNPPRISFPPLCNSPFLPAQEPTSISSIAAVNLLQPGASPLGNPAINEPPSNLLSPEQNSYFQGPSASGVPIQQCQPYMMRQQVGHYLYMVERGRREVLVLNSNRMTVIDRIPTPDPTSLAMSPNLDLLAVANQTADQVTFIDINPASATFHQVVRSVSVGRRPRGIAWDPGNEDILVCNEADNSVTLISALTLLPRKVVRTNLDGPFDVAITPRQDPAIGSFGFRRNVYFAWIINRSGRLALFESGPNGIAGWGFDDVIGVSSEVFQNPKAVQPDYVDLRSGCWVVHEGPLDPATGAPGLAGVGAVTNYGIVSAQFGQVTLTSTTTSLRDLDIGVYGSIGSSGELSGVPIDIAFDNMRHIAGIANFFTPFSAGNPIQINGKGLVRQPPGLLLRRTTTPTFMFVAVPNPFQGSGVVDVINVDGSNFRQDTNAFAPGVQSIPVPDVAVLMDYFRQ